MNRERALRISLALTLLLGTFLRFFRLGVPSMWLDELFSRGVALAPTLEDSILQGSVKDMFPPLFPMLSHWVVRLSGDAEAVFRLPSAIAGSASVLVVYLLGEILHSRKLGVVAAAILACHWFAVAYSQEGRPYALLLLLSTLSAYLGVRVVVRQRRGQSTHGTWIALGVTGLLLCYLHYIGVLFFAGVAALVLVATLRDRASLKGSLWTFGAVGVAYLPWLSTVTSQIERRLTEKTPPPARAILKTYSDLLARHPLLFGLLLALGWLAYRRVPEPPAASDERALRPSELGVLLAAWVTLPVLVTFCLSYLVVPFYTTRNMIVMLPAFALLAALALHQLERVFLRELPLASLLLVLGLALDLAVVKDYYAARKEPFEQFARHIVEAGEATDALFVQPELHAKYLEQYLDLLGSGLHASRGTAASAPSLPAIVWIVARDRQPEPPARYQAIASWTHEPDRRLPWAGQPMLLTRYRRMD